MFFQKRTGNAQTIERVVALLPDEVPEKKRVLIQDFIRRQLSLSPWTVVPKCETIRSRRVYY